MAKGHEPYARIPAPMRLTHLSLTNFRNFVRLETDISAGTTLITGANAQGKTSLLEAVHYLSGAHSPHAISDRQLINFLALDENPPVSRLVAELQRADRLQRIEIRLVLEPAMPGSESRLRKEILINGVRRRVSDLAGIMTSVMFLPQDMRVIEGTPGERRRHLDASLCQADALYAQVLAEYAKVLGQRNALLKQLQERGGDELDFWDERLVDLAATLMRSRATALAELEMAAEPIHRALTSGLEGLRLVYDPSHSPGKSAAGQLGLPFEAAFDWHSVTRQDLIQGMQASLKAMRREEISRGMTLIGPHRDDVIFRAAGLDLRTYGSRGQNRTAMLALKLAEIEWLEQRTGEHPVLLLDEVLAELDVPRRERLLASVAAAPQTLLTSADRGMFSEAFCRQATIWQIDAGRLIAQAA
jgi:DNA replication and repair protein RecF